MKAINRLFEYFEYKGIKPTRFEKEIGISNGYFGKQLAKNADLGSGILELIIENCPDLNIDWVLSGRETMLNTQKNQNLSQGNIGKGNKNKVNINNGSKVNIGNGNSLNVNIHKLENERDNLQHQIELLTAQLDGSKREIISLKDQLALKDEIILMLKAK